MYYVCMCVCGGCLGTYACVSQRLPMRPNTGFLGAVRGAGGGEEVQAGNVVELKGAAVGAVTAEGLRGGWRERSSLKTESI